jgi:hypothetical protein
MAHANVEHAIAWRVWWQDYTGRQPGIGLPFPDICRTDYRTKQEAESRREQLRAQGREIIACITPVFAATAKKAKKKAKK